MRIDIMFMNMLDEVFKTLIIPSEKNISNLFKFWFGVPMTENEKEIFRDYINPRGVC